MIFPDPFYLLSSRQSAFNFLKTLKFFLLFFRCSLSHSQRSLSKNLRALAPTFESVDNLLIQRLFKQITVDEVVLTALHDVLTLNNIPVIESCHGVLMIVLCSIYSFLWR